MLSKNKLSELDEDKNAYKDKYRDKDKTKTKTEDKTIPKTKTKTEDKDQTTTKTKTKIEDKDWTKIEDKDKDIDMGGDKLIQMFQHARLGRSKKGNLIKRQIAWVFWNDGHVSELCKKWMLHNHDYAYTWFEELRTHSDEMLFTRDHKAITSKDKPKTCIDVDKLRVFKDFITNR